MIGRSIGRFRILALLGEGGMAKVWRARDELLGRDLALKILADSLAQSNDARKRFRREAHIAAQLDHPGIAAVYDSGQTDDVTWIAMALIEGETLSERITRSLIPIPQITTVGTVVAEALDYAHRRGVIHRDVTSRNVMLGHDGRVFVLDFGLALAQGASRVSSSGTTVGTAPYMAPELLLGGTADARSDLYGLGAVLYEALTGTLPFAGEGHAAAVFARLHQPIRPPRELRPEVSPALEAVVLRCLARDPDARFADARELSEALRFVSATPRAAATDLDAPTPAADGARNGGTPVRSFAAERLADQSGPVYLAIPEFEAIELDEMASPPTAGIARSLTAAAGAGLSQLQRLHVVPAPSPPANRSADALREYARSLGTQLVLLGDVRRSGTRLRVSWALHDAEAELRIAGDSLEGTSLDPFELEDRVLSGLRQALARERGEMSEVSRGRPSDPAAPERYQQALRNLERHDHEASVDGAIAILERLIESDGESAARLGTLARAQLCKYDLTRQRAWEAKAAATAARAAALGPEAPETLLALADLHRVAGRFAEAEREYGLALAQRPNDFEATLGRARTLDAQGRHEEADRECQRATAARPEDWRGHSMLGYLRLMRGDHRQALEPLREAVRLSPDNSRAARNLGSVLFRLDRFEEAVVESLRSIELQPNAAALTNLGTSLCFLGRYGEACQAFDRAIAMVPADPVHWGNLGNALRYDATRRDEFRPALERAVGLMRERLDRHPADPEARARMAGWLANLGEPEQAESAIREALRLAPDDPAVNSHAGHVFHQLGRRDEALRHLRSAIRHGFGARFLAMSPDLASLKGDPEFMDLLRTPPAEPPGGEPDS